MKSQTSPDSGQTPDFDLFDGYLENFQEDIKKIIGKYRRPNHHLSPEEVTSEVNHSLLEKRESIVSNFEGEFTESIFKKIAYAFVRNVLKWSQWRIGRLSLRRKENGHRVLYGRWRQELAFDMALETPMVAGEDFYEDFDRNSKCKFLLKMVKDYCSILYRPRGQGLILSRKGYEAC